MPTTVSSTRNVILYFVALVLPPVAAFFMMHDTLPDFWINICLTILGWIPGVLHAWYVSFHSCSQFICSDSGHLGTSSLGVREQCNEVMTSLTHA
ncbi:hypothetical protein BDR03DRAFT_923413 [Suillus americanus]|nr:hypothetical protein BDR03DRAFT_923413 [Suillus americanus]